MVKVSAQIVHTGISTKDGVIRVLEIGGGSGSTTVQCLECLQQLKIPFQYTFTDISVFLLNTAKKIFADIPVMRYQVFNIEEDPLNQGFAPNEFDIIIGVQVVHATASLFNTVLNLKKVLKPKGLLLLGESFKPHANHLFIFGMLEGWWRFEDFRKDRKLSALADGNDWTRIFKEAGFRNVALVGGFLLGVVAAQNTDSIEINKTSKNRWHVVKDMSGICQSISMNFELYGREIVAIEGPYGNYETENLEGIIIFCTEYTHKDLTQIQNEIATRLLNILQEYPEVTKSYRTKPRIVLITRGLYTIGDSEPGDPNGATAWGMLKVFRNEYSNVHLSLIDLDPCPTASENDQIVSLMWSQSEEYFTALREDRTYVLRLRRMDKSAPPIHLPSTDRIRFANPPSGAFGDIEVGPSSRDVVCDDKIEIEIKACALNLRDLFFVLKPEGFSLPDVNSGNTLDSVGLDISGVVTSVGSDVTRFKIGDEVFGMTAGGGLASHTVLPEQALMKVPKSLTFEEACTIPCAFVTACGSLVDVAKIASTDRVLIHAASGGVGLASIQVLRVVGSEIYATAGSKRKRAYLRALGIKNVYKSRDTSYKDKIMQDTKGLGVSVVLNSLTGPNFKESTLAVCSKGARFIEIGKINIWKPKQVSTLRPDVEYHVVDISSEESMQNCTNNSMWYYEVMLHIEKFVKLGKYTGLPTTVFELQQVREAFQYFQKALHIGKVIVRIPKYVLSETGKGEHKNQQFNDRSTYLITGGLGGIGIEVAKWMRTMGAKTIVLFGRSIAKVGVQQLVQKWNREGSNIWIFNGDVGEYNDCQALLKLLQALKLHQLRGIMHAAGVLSDNLISKQSVSSIEKVFWPKVYGSWHLHNLTLQYPLEFFVMFSSISAMLALVGQCNHSGANRYLDALAHYRVAMGLKATTINWGGWSDVGAASNVSSVLETFTGIRMFTPAQGIAALQNIMRSQVVQVMVGEVPDWNVTKLVAMQGLYLSDMESIGTDDKKLEINDHLVEAIKTATSPEIRREKVQLYIETVLKKTLDLSDSEVLDPDQNTSELGVDSLMVMEMKNQFQTILENQVLTISAIQENRTIRSLTDHLVQLLNASQED